MGEEKAAGVAGELSGLLEKLPGLSELTRLDEGSDTGGEDGPRAPGGITTESAAGIGAGRGGSTQMFRDTAVSTGEPAADIVTSAAGLPGAQPDRSLPT